MLQKGVLDGLIFIQDKNERYNYECHMLEGAEIEPENEKFYLLADNKTSGGHSVFSTPSADEIDENDDELLQKYLGDAIWKDQDDPVKNDETVDPCLFQRADPNHDLLLREKDFANSNSIKRTSTSNSHTPAPSFLQETNKKRKKKGETRFHLASTLNFPYKEGLSSPSSVKEGIWKGQGEQADMLEKHFNSAWQCKFMMDFYGIGGSCHPHDEVAAGELWNLRKGEEKTSKKESTAILFNRDLSKDTTLNSNMVSPGILVHSCREKRSDEDTSKEYIYTEEDLKSASVKLMDAMDLTDDSRTKVFRIEESMNINRTKYLYDICMMK